MASKFSCMIRWIALALIVCACTSTEKETKADNTASSVADGAGIPADALKEEFTDSKGMTRVTLSVDGGSKSADGTYVNGKREGVWTEYYTNGLVKTVTSYVNGEKEGLYMELNNSGQITKRFYYHKGLRHGDYKEYNYSNLKEERIYRFGKIEGTVKIYYDNLRIMEEGNYKNGVRDGVSKWYDPDGKVSIEYEYKNGELIKK